MLKPKIGAIYFYNNQLIEIKAIRSDENKMNIGIPDNPKTDSIWIDLNDSDVVGAKIDDTIYYLENLGLKKINEKGFEFIYFICEEKNVKKYLATKSNAQSKEWSIYFSIIDGLLNEQYKVNYLHEVQDEF